MRNYLSDKEIEKLFRVLDSKRDKLLFSLMLETGCTVNEIVHLKSKDVKGKNIRIPAEYTKNKKARTVHISTKFAKKLQTHTKSLKKDDFLIPTRQSTQISPRRIQQLCKYYKEKAKLSIDITPYTLRYTKISREISKNKKEDIEKELGVKNIKINDFLDKEELAAISKTLIKERNKVLLGILCETGCTVHEASQIKVKDIDKGMVKIGSRHVPLPKKLSDTIKSFIKKHSLGPKDHILFSRQGSRITERRIQQIVKKCAHRAGICKDITPYTLRYTYIKNQLDNDVPYEDIESLLGIKNIALVARGLLHV